MTIHYDTAVVIGRFQPLHDGHLALIEHAASIADHVVVICGGRNNPRTEKDPWTTHERAVMLWNAVPDWVAEKMYVSAVSDYESDRDWCVAVDQNPYVSGNVALVGYKKDASSEYLTWFPRWDYVPFECADMIHATDIRRYLRAGAFDMVKTLVPASVFEQIVPWCVEEEDD